MAFGREKGRAHGPPLHRHLPAQLRSARAARLSLELPLELVSLLPEAPIVLPPPLLLLVSDEPLLAAGALAAPELVLGGVEELDDDEPLAPIEVPPLLGELELDELVDGELLVSLLPLLLGVLLVLPLLEPEAPMLRVDGSLGLVALVVPPVLVLPAAGEAALPPAAPGELPLLELWAMARPPNARAAAAARVVRVVLVALMLNSLIDMLGNAPAMARRLTQD